MFELIRVPTGAELDKDLRQQESWLSSLAHQAGFQDLDSWASAQAENFCNACAEWRMSHPI